MISINVFQDFSVEQLRSDARRAGSADFKKIALDIYKQVIMRSPVATGRFKGNWQVRLNGPALSAINRFQGKGDSGMPDAAVITSANGLPKIFITNNLPYAARLEQGWSKQAPTGVANEAVQSVMSRFT